ncbi:MAG: PmoA family protein [Limisphaerales bacterium]
MKLPLLAVLAGLHAVAFAAGSFCSGPVQTLSAELKPDRVVITVAGKVFTEYLFKTGEKYPYFFPVNGPRTGRSVTTCRAEPYPHHSSVFFGCDKINGGNYWQEELERGRIVSKDVKFIRAAGNEVVFEQDCRWERPGAEAPFDDHRRIKISASSPDLRLIDFEVTLTARIKVRIDMTNHSLFSARMAPELSVKAGGRLVNAHGDEAEKGTFGKPAPWMDACGTRDGQTEGLAIFCDPKNRWHPAPWFTRDYGFLSPTPMWWLEGGFVEFAPGEKLHLRYRVLIHAGALSRDRLQAEHQRWADR